MTQPVVYDRGDVHRFLTRLGELLADLRYVDRALAYLQEQDMSFWETVAARAGIYRGYSVMVVELGRTVPFRRIYDIPYPPINPPWQFGNPTEEEIRGHLRSLEEEASRWAAANVVYLWEQVAPYTHSSPALYEHGVVEPLRRGHARLEDEVTDDFAKLRHSFSDWKGIAADNFASEFYHPFKHTLDSHKRLLLALAGAVKVAKAVDEVALHSVTAVLDAGCRALETQLRLRAGQAERERQETQRKALILAASTGGLVATVLGTSSLWAVGAAAAAESLTVFASGDLDETWKEVVFRTTTAEEILGEIVEKLTGVDRRVDDQLDELRAQVDDVLSRVSRLRRGRDGDDGRLIPIRPVIVDGVDAETFYLP